MCELENGRIMTSLPLEKKASIVEEVGGRSLSTRVNRYYAMPSGAYEVSVPGGLSIAQTLKAKIAELSAEAHCLPSTLPEMVAVLFRKYSPNVWVFLRNGGILVDGDIRPSYGGSFYAAAICSESQTAKQREFLTGLAAKVQQHVTLAQQHLS